jgi:hypothetical protein
MLSKSDGPVEEWIAQPGGGFKRAEFDLPALLYEVDLVQLYDQLCGESMLELIKRHEEDRVTFLEYLKNEVGMTKLADRQLLANALGRARRLGSLPGEATKS